MFRKSSLLLAVLGILAVAPAAHAVGFSIGVHGGVAVPTGDFSDETDGLDAGAGPEIGFDVSYMLTESFAVGVDGSWLRNKHGAEGETEDLGGGTLLTADKDRFNILQFGAHAKYMFPMVASPVHPYLVLGAGIYNLKEDYEYTLYDPTGPTTLVFTDESDNFEQPGSRLGGKLGLGAMFRATDKMDIDLQANFNLITMDEDETGLSNLKYMSVRAGINFHVMPQ